LDEERDIMKTALKYLLALGIFLGGLGVLAGQYNVGKDTPRPQAKGCCGTIADDGR
jgi:hypothetical protein